MAPAAPTAEVLAHAGGVPEALTVALPLLIFGSFMLAERRARRREREAREAEGGTEPAPD